MRNRSAGGRELSASDEFLNRERTDVSNVAAAELDLENLLLRMPQVLGARVQLRPEGTVERIHVLADRSASTRRVAFEVERLLGEQRALRLDPGVVSVVALEDGAGGGEETAAARREPGRIEFRRLTFEPVDELRVRASVELMIEEILFTGEATEPDVPRARPALAGRAVLAALAFLREHGAAFYLESIGFLDGFHAPLAVAVIGVLSERTRRSLPGCALVEDSRTEAAARATLDAINRFYGALRPADAPSGASAGSRGLRREGR